MTTLLRAGVGAISALVLTACSSVSDDIKRKCASAPDPAACQRAQYEQMRAADEQRLQENSIRHGGGY